MADGSVIIDSKLDKSGLEKGLSTLGNLTGSAMGLAAKGIAAVSAGLTALGGFAINAGMNFDSAMSQVAATMGTTVDEIQILSDKAKEMGESTKFSATEAAEALNYLALAGYDAATAADTLPAVLDLAAAGGMSLAYASDLATDAMSALGIEASQANLTDFGDKMAMTASRANTSVAQLGEAILTVGGTAKTLAGGTTELNTALGILANRGIKGAEGGTHLRNVILSLTAPTEKSAEAMKKLGVSATTSTGEMRPLNEVMADFNRAMEGMTDAQKVEALNTIFNKTDIAAVQGLLAGCGDEWNKLAGAIDNAGGAMHDMAETQIDNLEGDITILKSAAEGLGIAMYEGFRGPMRDIVQLGTEMVGELTAAMKKGGYKKLASALGDVLSRAISTVTGYLPKVISLAADVIEGLCDGIKENIDAIAEGLAEAVSEAVSGISRVLPKLVEAGIVIATNLAKSIANELPRLIPEVITGLMQTIVALCRNVDKVVEAGAAIAKGLIEGIILAIPALIGGVIEAVGGLLESVTGFFKGKPAEATVKIKADTTDADAGISGVKTDLDGLEDKDVKVSLLIDDANTKVKTLSDDLTAAKNQYIKDAIDIKVNYDSAQPLIDQLAEIQTKSGNAKVSLTGLNGYSTSLSSMAQNATTMAEKVNGFVSAAMKEETVTSFKEAAGHLDSIATDCQTLGTNLAGLSDAEYAEPEDLKSAAADAGTLADKCLAASNMLTGIAGTNGLMGYKKEGLLSMAKDLEGMAKQATTLQEELSELSGKEYLTEEDKQRIAEITTKLTELYPQLKSYIGEDGLIHKEAGEIRDLTTAWRDLLLAQAAEKYKQQALEALTDAEMANALLEQAVENAGQQKALAEQEQALWQTVADSVGQMKATLAEGLTNLLNGEGFTGDAQQVTEALQLVETYLYQLGGTIEDFPNAEDIDLSKIFNTDGNMLSAEEIMGDADALRTLFQVMTGMQDVSWEKLDEANQKIEANEQAVKEATEAYNANQPVIEQARTEYEQYSQVIEKATSNAKALEEANKGTADSAEAAGDAAAQAGEKIEESGESIKEGGEAAKEGAGDFKEANEEIQSTAENAETGAEDVGNAAKTVTDKAKEITDAANALKTAQTTAEAAAAAVKTAQTGITTDAAAALKSAQDTATAIDLLAQAMLETIKGIFTEEAVAQFAECGKAIVVQISTGMETAAVESTFTAAGTSVYNAAKSALTTALGENGSKFNVIGKSIVTGVAKGMSDAATKAAFSSAAAKVKTAAYNAMSDAVGANGSSFKTIGKNICTGVAAGIDENSGSIASAARRAARAAYSAAMDEIDSNSPSKLFRRTVGKYISLGMALGIEDGIPDIENSVGNAIDSISGLNDLDLTLDAANQMRAAAAERNTVRLTDEDYASDPMDYDKMAQAIWENAPEDLAVNQTVNFNYPMQAPDEVARAIRDQNTYGLVGARR